MKIAPFQVERFFAEYEHRVPYVLCGSGLTALTLEEILAFGGEDQHQAFLKRPLDYLEANGTVSLREGIATLYENIHPEEILVHAGSAEAIFTLMNAALAPGDHVIVHFPTYPSLYELPRAMGCDVTLWETHPETGWTLEPDVLESLIRPQTKALILNIPNNPTGYLPDLGSFQAILDIAKAHHLLVICDEAYRFLEYQEDKRLPSVCDCYDNAIVTGSMSKSFALPGLRVGWIATQNKELYQKIAEFKDYTSICINQPSEYIANLALQHKDRIFARNRGLLEARYQELASFLKAHQDCFQFSPPEAGAVIFPRLNVHQDPDIFYQRLRETEGVLLLPGRCFDFDNHHFRLGFGQNNLAQGLAILKRLLNQALV